MLLNYFSRHSKFKCAGSIKSSMLPPELNQMYLQELQEAYAMLKILNEKSEIASAETQKYIINFHRLKGVSAIMGYADIGIVAGQIEKALKSKTGNINELLDLAKNFINLASSKFSLD